MQDCEPQSDMYIHGRFGMGWLMGSFLNEGIGDIPGLSFVDLKANLRNHGPRPGSFG